MKPMAIVVCAALALLLLPSALSGQAVNGTLLGTITDTSGASVPNARVTATETNTGVARQTTSSESGYYAFPDLRPGVYTVAVEQTGFRKAVRENAEVIVNSTLRVDMQLQPGSQSEVVNVTAEAPPLQTDRSDTGRKIETKAVADLPLSTNRNFQSLLNLVPGTTRAFRPHSEFFNSQDALATQVNGQSRLANNVQFEGVDNNHRTGLLTALIPPIEAIQTVDISTSNYDAELGRAGGAVTNVILKSGTNDFHGSLYEFNRVSALMARNYFSRTVPPSTYNYFGGTFGGAIIRNRTFFFGDYLRILDRRGQNNRFQLPTADFRAGNFSQASTVIYDPRTGNPDGSGRTPFPGNIIPDDRISPLARKVLALVPLPNLAGYGTNYDRNSTLAKDTDSWDVKLDHIWTQNDRFSYRYSWFRPKITDPSIFGLAGGPRGGGFMGIGTNTGYSTALNYNKIFSPTLISELRLGAMHYRNEAQQSDYGTDASEQLGVRGVNLDPWSSGLFSVEIGGGYSNPMVGWSASLPWIRAETNFNVVNTWTKTVGSHTVKWGADIRRVRDDLLQTQAYNPRGVFRFNGDAITACRDCANGSQTRTGFANNFATFLLDLPNQIGRDLAVVFPAWRQTQFFLYAQDKWQLTPKLTLDLGVRWEHYRPPTPRFAGGFSNYDPNTNSLLLAGIGDIPMDMGLRRNWLNFAPRTGIAYRFSERTVIRTGFGISYVPFPDNTWAYNYPVKQNNVYNSVNPYTPAVLPDGRYAGLSTGFPAPQVVQIPSSGIISPAPLNQSYDVINPNFREGYVQSWNFAVQQSLPGNYTFEAAYVGNHGVRIPYSQALNASMIVGSGPAGRPLYQRFGKNNDVNMRSSGLSSLYNSLQIKIDRRYSGGIAMTNAYTFGKGMGFTDENGGLQYWIDQRRNYARLGFDRTHTFVNSTIFELPFGRGKPMLSTGPGAWILGGWQVNGILTLMSGAPLNFTASSAGLNAPGNSQSPNINGPVKILYGIDNDFWFDASNFSLPPPLTFGNLGRNVLSGPGFFNLDASLFRRFTFTERWALELRAEAFSVTNTPQFNNPDTGLGNANFGKVKGAGGNRSVQLGAKLVF